MSLENHAGAFIGSCDFCSETEECDDAVTFQDAVGHLKEEGWNVYKEDGEWQHKCRCCCESDYVNTP